MTLSKFLSDMITRENTQKVTVEGEGKVHSEVISSQSGEKSRRTSAFRLKGTTQRHGPLLWICYCVDRLLDTHNPFGDKCADRGE